MGYPCERDLGPVTGVPPERTWDQWKYYGMQMGFPPVLADTHLSKHNLPLYSYGGGNNGHVSAMDEGFSEICAGADHNLSAPLLATKLNVILTFTSLLAFLLYHNTY